MSASENVKVKQSVQNISYFNKDPVFTKILFVLNFTHCYTITKELLMSGSLFPQKTIDSFVSIFVCFFDIFSNHRKHKKKMRSQKKKKKMISKNFQNSNISELNQSQCQTMSVSDKFRI